MIGMYYSNRYFTGDACRHCGELVSHARWCMTQNDRVQYAYILLSRPDLILPDDDQFLKLNRIDWRLPDART